MMLMQSQAGMQTPQLGSSPISDSRTPPGSSGSGCPMRSREASPLDTAAARECRCEVEANEDTSPKSNLVVSPPLLKSLELEGAKTNLAEVYFIGTPPVSAELLRLDKAVKEVGDSLSNTGSTNPAPQDWLSSPRDALPPRPCGPSAPSQPRRHASAGSVRNGRCPETSSARRATGSTPGTKPASPRRKGEEVSGGPARRTPSAAAMRAGRKLREACSPPRNASAGMRQGSAAKGALPKENKRPARPSSKWAWKEQDIRTTPPDRGGSTSSPRSARPEAKVRAALSGTPSARVVAALEGPQGLMSLLGRLAPREASVASTPAPTPTFWGASGEDFHPTDWAAHLRQGQPTSPMARSKSQGALRRAWSPVGPCNSPPKWQPAKLEKASPRVPPPPTRLMSPNAEITLRPR